MLVKFNQKARYIPGLSLTSPCCPACRKLAMRLLQQTVPRKHMRCLAGIVLCNNTTRYMHLDRARAIADYYKRLSALDESILANMSSLVVRLVASSGHTVQSPASADPQLTAYHQTASLTSSHRSEH